MLSHVKRRDRICFSTVCYAVAFGHELTYSPGCGIFHCSAEVVMGFRFCGRSHMSRVEFVQMNVVVSQQHYIQEE